MQIFLMLYLTCPLFLDRSPLNIQYGNTIFVPHFDFIIEATPTFEYVRIVIKGCCGSIDLGVRWMHGRQGGFSSSSFPNKIPKGSSVLIGSFLQLFLSV